MNNAGLTVTIEASWVDDKEQSESNYTAVYGDPSIETITLALVKLIEASYGWGASRQQIIYRIKDALLEVEGM